VPLALAGTSLADTVITDTQLARSSGDSMKGKSPENLSIDGADRRSFAPRGLCGASRGSANSGANWHRGGVDNDGGRGGMSGDV
jgi:hypothetical protein